MALSSEQLAVVGTLAGVLIASLFGAFNNWVNKRAEERKYFIDVVIKAGVENWKHVSERQLALYEKGHDVTIYSLELFILHLAKACEVYFDPTVSEDNVERRLAKADRIFDLVEKYREKQNQDNQDTKATP